jgi:hypothetical protein
VLGTRGVAIVLAYLVLVSTTYTSVLI